MLVHEASGWTVVRIEGDLDARSGLDLMMVLGGVIGAGRTRIAVDLSAIGACDLPGARRVLSAAAQARHSGGELIVVHDRPSQSGPGLRELARALPVVPAPPR